MHNAKLTRFTLIFYRVIVYLLYPYRYAAEHGVILVNPDTSPRGLNLPGDSDSWDFGVGAGFYVNATEKPWSSNYRMFSYVTSELLNIVNENFPVNGKQSIMGHRYVSLTKNCLIPQLKANKNKRIRSGY